MVGDPVVRLFGPVALFDAGQSVDVSSERQRRLLAALALHAPNVVSVDRLIDVVWAGPAPENATRTLQSYVSRLRSTLAATPGVGDDPIVRIEPGYALAAHITTDASAFESLAAESRYSRRDGDLAGAAAALKRALGLCRGEPLAEFADEDWARPTAQRLADLRVGALEDLAECELGLGEAGAAITLLEPLVAELPLRERPRGLLMRALHAAGRQPEALRAYQDFYTLLAEELGLSPSPELTGLEAQIATGTLPDVGPTPRSDPGREGPPLPTGTVTFLFTDVEGSTRMWEEHTEEMEAALERHDAILRTAIEAHQGYVFSLAGDAFVASFQDHDHAVAAAVEAQDSLAREAWPEPTPIRVRMGLHVGNAQERDGDYFGPTLNLASRVTDAGHGGQILLSSAANEVIRSAETRSLGMHRLKDLSAAQEIFELVIAGRPDGFPALRTLDAVAHNLPVVSSALIGRADDVSAVSGLLGGHRLVTVVGVGGIGKTRLVLDVAAGMIDGYPDGVWLCELAPIGEPDAVADSVAQILGAKERLGYALVDSIAEFCRRRRLLLVLDNCEHVIDAAAGLAEAILAVAPDVDILATSREGLAASEEVSYPLRSLDTDGHDNPATELFVRRAAEADPSRMWSDDDLAAIARICDRLDGMPLAIELAATRTRTQTPSEIEARLDEAFRELRGGRRSVERHRTLHAAIDWSYATLTPREQILFQRLSVFAGSCDLDAIEAVCADDALPAAHVLELLDDLVAKSLVLAEHGRGSSTRYRLLEPLRQFAEDRLAAAGGSESIRDAHLDHYTRWAEWWDDALWGPTPDLHISLELEFANARSALFWALARNNVEQACRIVASLVTAQHTWRRLEVGSWAARVLERPEAMAAPKAPVVASVAAMWCWWRAAMEEGHAFAALIEEMECFDPTSREGNITRHVFALQGGDLEKAEAILDQIAPTTLRGQLEVVQQRQGRVMWQPVWGTLSPAESEQTLATLQELASESGSLLLRIIAEGQAGTAALVARDFGAAATSLRRTIDAAESIGATYFVHFNLSWLGMAAAGSGRVLASDFRAMRDGLDVQRDTGDELDQWLILVGAAVALLGFGGHELAADVHVGIQSSPWAGGLMERVIPLYSPEVPADVAPAANPVELADLVDRVIEAIDEVLADWQENEPRPG